MSTVTKSPNIISIVRGDFRTVNVQVKKHDPSDPNPDVSKRRLIPVDMSGATAVLTVKEHAVDLPPLIQKAATVVDGAKGKIKFLLEQTDTISMLAGQYIYDIVITLAGTAATVSFKFTEGPFGPVAAAAGIQVQGNGMFDFWNNLTPQTVTFDANGVSPVIAFTGLATYGQILDGDVIDRNFIMWAELPATGVHGHPVQAVAVGNSSQSGVVGGTYTLFKDAFVIVESVTNPVP